MGLRLSEADARRLCDKSGQVVPAKPKKPPDWDNTGGTHLERMWDTYWLMFADGVGLPTRLVKFHQYEFDRAWEPERVVVEMDGRDHMRETVFHRDRRKSNMALSEGWLLFRFTEKMLREEPQGCVLLVAEAIMQRRYT